MKASLTVWFQMVKTCQNISPTYKLVYNSPISVISVEFRLLIATAILEEKWVINCGRQFYGASGTVSIFQSTQPRTALDRCSAQELFIAVPETGLCTSCMRLHILIFCLVVKRKKY